MTEKQLEVKNTISFETIKKVVELSLPKYCKIKNLGSDNLHTKFLFTYLVEQEILDLGFILKDYVKECEHPYHAIHSKCGYEKCLQCGKVLCEG